MQTGQPLYSQVAVHFNGGNEKLVGAVTAHIVAASKCEDQGLIDEQSHSQLMYILTLGSDQGYRRQGIATALIERCLQEAAQDPYCGGVRESMQDLLWHRCICMSRQIM